MRTKGVFLLGLIVCWTAVCNSEDESKYDISIKDKLERELAKEYLLLANIQDTENKDDPEEETGDGGETTPENKEDPEEETGDGGETTPEATDEPEGETGADVVTTDDDPCTTNPCTDSKKCVVAKEDPGYVCVCPENKKGEKCNLDKECSSDSCKNGGTCVENEETTGYTCECPEEKKGSKCEFDKECKPESCKNGGTCVENKESSGFTCKCPKEKKGSKCEFDMDCKPDSCENGGTCVENPGASGFNCTCPTNKKGKKCELERECKPESCTTGKICKEPEESSGFTCVCPPNRKGNTCEFENDCKPDSCTNGGTCVEKAEASGFTCSCPANRKGLRCQLEKDCKPDSCANGGTCTENTEASGFTCSCPANKKGTKCELDKDCKSDTCKNGGTCNENANAKGFACICVGFWRGNTCEEDPCASNPCKNGGTCSVSTDAPGFTCSCTEIWAGKNCEKECDCGNNGKCHLDERGNKKCDCSPGFLLKRVNNKDICVETCTDSSECNGGECKGEEGKRFCECKNEKVGDKCEHLKDCVTGGKYSKCEESGGSCLWNVNKVECTCTDPQKLDPARNFCRRKCSAAEPCKHEGDCRNELCQCKTGTQGDDCGEITGCKALECDKKEATCTFKPTKNPHTFCVCNDEKYLFVNNRCAEKCNEDKDCQNGGTCKANLCDCKSGTSGDKCEKIAGCDNLKCEEKQATCIFDLQGNKPTCKCNDQSYYYDDGKCKPIWCKDGCSKDSDCEYNNGVGVCKCKKEGTYYNYAAGKCETIDKCFNITCGDGTVCKNGVCACDANHQKKDDKCEPKDFCDKKSNLCFKDANCEPSSPNGYVRCTCNDTDFYNPRQRKCEAGVCFLPDHRKDCTKRCPRDMERKDGYCKHKTEISVCDKDCGTLGWCYNVSASSQLCVCEPDVSELNAKTGKCVLKATAVCPTQEKDGDDKCKCTGKYKPAKNGITCELKSCSDEDVQNECKNKRAEKCVDDWRISGYKCVCPDGYVDDPKKGCIDPCSMDTMKTTCLSKGKVCYIGSKIKEGDCRCPPTFIENPTTKICELNGENTFMIQGLPVISKKYETADKNINKVLLNIDVTNSMKQAFKKLDFAHVLNFKIQEGVLLCDIWLQFQLTGLPEKFKASLEVQRWKSNTVEANDQQLLPPALYLSNNFKDATETELTLCSPSVQQSLCGRGSDCVNNTCSCPGGYREIDSTIKTYGDKGRIVRCEDIDECKEETHECPANSKCVNTEGDYFCRCNSGFRKVEGAADELDKKACIGLCEAKPCGKGECKLTKENAVDCTCQPGYSGSFCNRKDEILAKASQATKVVGAVLGTLLAIVIILIIVYIVRQRKNSYSEDFTPAPRADNAEMIERRPIRGVTNRAYQ